jgi:hypothetical protein
MGRGQETGVYIRPSGFSFTPHVVDAPICILAVGGRMFLLRKTRPFLLDC